MDGFLHIPTMFLSFWAKSEKKTPRPKINSDFLHIPTMDSYIFQGQWHPMASNGTERLSTSGHPIAASCRMFRRKPKMKGPIPVIHRYP